MSRLFILNHLVFTDWKLTAESAHRVTISLDGLKPLTITLPHPILPSSLKTLSHSDDGIAEITATKALRHVSSSDDVRAKDSRWNVETLEAWKDEETLKGHLDWVMDDGEGIVDNPLDAKSLRYTWHARDTIRQMFIAVTQNGQFLFQVRIKGSSTDAPDFYIRAHPPVRISPEGDPTLVLSVLDQNLAEEMKKEGKLDSSRSAKDFLAAFDSQTDAVHVLHLDAIESGQLLRYIFRKNSSKMQPTPWQVENLPLSSHPATCPWLATFVQPSWCAYSNQRTEPLPPLPEQHSRRCWNCSKSSSKDKLSRCARCKAVAYCSAECQRADWASHKSSCSKA